jgi:hypothetical protein
VLGRTGESYSISAGIDAASARRVLRSHMRSQLRWAVNPVEVSRRGGVYGFVLGPFVHVRAVTAGTRRTLLKDSLAANGRIVSRPGGCEISLRVHAPRLPALLPAAASVLGALLTLALFIDTGALWLLVCFLVFVALCSMTVVFARAHRVLEPRERELLRDWVDALESNLRDG